jgi:hypothetical protein
MYGLSKETAGLFRRGSDIPDISCCVAAGAATIAREQIINRKSS